MEVLLQSQLLGQIYYVPQRHPLLADSTSQEEFLELKPSGLHLNQLLALNPKVIIADEAVSALDVSIRGQIINLLLDLQRDFGIAYLFISHDMAVVERISHRVAVMYLGQIVEIGPRRAVFENPQHPYTRKLLAAVPVAEPSRQRPQRVLLSDDLPSNIHLRGEEVAAVSLQCVGPGHYVAQPQSEYAFMRR